MKEIYRDSDDVLRLEVTDKDSFTNVDASTNVTIRITDPNDSSISAVTGTAINVTTGVYEFDLPFSLTNNDRILKVEWTYRLGGIQRTVTHYVNVVTPYVTLAELFRMFNNTSEYSVDELREMERKVRYIIDNFTGQEFGSHTGSYTIFGTGQSGLHLPYRMISHTGVKFGGVEYDPTSYYLGGSGWYLGRMTNTPLTIKEAPPEEMLDGWTGVGGVIYPPLNSYWDIFRSDTQYTITGKWGYESVPAEVNLAARILLNDYACDQSLWRDRYIKSIRASDWTFQFDSGAFSGTGNVQADQLLSGFVQTNMVVI